MPASRDVDKKRPSDPDVADHPTPATIPPVSPIATIPVNPGGDYSPPADGQQPTHIPKESTKLPSK